MSQKMILRESKFIVKAENVGPAIDALHKAIREQPTIIDAEGDPCFFHTRNDEELLTYTNIFDLFEALGFFVIEKLTEEGTYSQGSILGVESLENMSYHGDLELIWQVLAPFIEPGYLEMEISNDGAHWRWNFNGKTCQSVYPPIVIWPPYEREQIGMNGSQLIEIYQLFQAWRSYGGGLSETFIFFDALGEGGIKDGEAFWYAAWETPEEAIEQIGNLIDRAKQVQQRQKGQ